MPDDTDPDRREREGRQAGGGATGHPNPPTCRGRRQVEAGRPQAAGPQDDGDHDRGGRRVGGVGRGPRPAAGRGGITVVAAQQAAKAVDAVRARHEEWSGRVAGGGTAGSPNCGGRPTRSGTCPNRGGRSRRFTGRSSWPAGRPRNPPRGVRYRRDVPGGRRAAGRRAGGGRGGAPGRRGGRRRPCGPPGSEPTP